jgi:hypothetical protein
MKSQDLYRTQAQEFQLKNQQLQNQINKYKILGEEQASNYEK